MSNQAFLIKTLETGGTFEGRYAGLQCVNFDPVNHEKRGCFSLVFKAYDQLERKAVAIKFFDPAQMTQSYRMKAFDREPEILHSLINKSRCLQIVSGLKTYNLEIDVGSGQKVFLPCKYFVVEWIEDEIDEFFENQESVDAILKLQLFHQIVLGVAALHRAEVHHRDVKVDNLRLRDGGSPKEAVVAIDLGTAARDEDDNLLAEYRAHVGHKMYSAPECYVGFAGQRSLGHLTDFYALGCLLFELFNRDFFYSAQRTQSPKYETFLAALALELQRCKTQKEREAVWAERMQNFRHAFSAPSIQEGGSSAPIAVANEIQKLVGDLTAFDFRSRLCDVDEILSRLQACIRVLANKALVKKRSELKALWKQNRILKLKKRAERAALVSTAGVVR